MAHHWGRSLFGWQSKGPGFPAGMEKEWILRAVENELYHL